MLLISVLALSKVAGCDADLIRSNLDSVGTLLIVGTSESEEDELVEDESAKDGSILLPKVGTLELLIISFNRINENASLGGMLLVIGEVEEEARVESEFDEDELGKALWKAGLPGLAFVIGSSSKIHE